MYVKVISDNLTKKGLEPGPGFSCLVGNKILFDTGESSHSLIANMDRMMVSIPEIEAVVISHEHWDHTGGLWELLKRKDGLKVYACPSSSETFKKCVKESGGKLTLVKKTVEILKGVFLTGEISDADDENPVCEQALVVKGTKGISAIVGCARPGILKMLGYVRKTFKTDRLYMALGGFHLENMDTDSIAGVISELRHMGIEKIAPAHCSGEKARRILHGKYHNNYIAVKAGHIIQL
ncbi:MAG: MBL fold metallo-hydrolase [Candidatus Omnitrophota bacterium]